MTKYGFAVWLDPGGPGLIIPPYDNPDIEPLDAEPVFRADIQAKNDLNGFDFLTYGQVKQAERILDAFHRKDLAFFEEHLKESV